MADRLPLFKFQFETADEAQRATHRAAYAGVVSAVVTVAFIVWSLSDPGAGLGGLVDAWSFLDVALLLALSYGTYRGNRFAAVALLVLYIGEQILTRSQAESPLSGLFLTGLFSVLFAQGIAAAFALHRMAQNRDLDEQLGALEAGPPAGEAASRLAENT